MLYVLPEARGHGIGAALVQSVAGAGRDAGFARLHLYTYAAEGYSARLGSQAVERFDDQGELSTFMVRAL